MSLASREADEVRPAPGLPLGPDSLTWQLFADVRMLLLGPRAAVLQNMLPALGQGVEDHSVFFADTAARLARTIPPIFNTVYAADRFVQPLGRPERDRIIRESVTWFERYGVSARGIPASWDEFEAYWDDVLEHRLVRHRTAAYGVGYATKGWPRPARVPPPLWWLVRRPVNAVSAFLTIGGMPERARELLDLPWDGVRERRYRRFARLVRGLDPMVRRLPPRMRLHPIAARAFAREVAR